MDTDRSTQMLMDAVSPIFSLTPLPAKPDGGLIALAVLLLVLLLFSAYCSATESSIATMNKIRIKAKADDGNKRAKNALFVVNNYERSLTTLLIGNNIVNIAFASIATVLATRLFASPDGSISSAVTLWCTILSTVVVFLFGEVIPKSFAIDRNETMALFSSGFLRFAMKLLYPIASIFTWISSSATKILSRFVKQEEEPSITEEELYDIIDTIEEEGVMNEEQGDLFKSALDFSGTRARDVMTMRNDIRGIDVTLSNLEILDIINETTHTRLPVFEGDLDHIIGILQIRTFIREYLKNPNVNLRTCLIPSFHVSPNALIDDLLSEMRQYKFYLGVVSDDEGKTLGIVTIEDFLEELVGEIWDEDDIVDNNFVKLGGNRFQIHTHLCIGEIFERIDVPCPDPRAAARPLLSLLLERFGRIPEEEESFLYHNLELTVETVENSRVETVVAHLLSDEELAERTAAASPDSEGSSEEEKEVQKQ